MPYLLAGALFAAYTALSVARHLRLRSTGYDLGIFEQAVRGYAELRAPVSELKGPGFHLLGDHFHPILALLAPAYRLFPSPLTLLVAQAALLALSAVPVTRLARDHIGPRSGLAIGAAYGLSWGLQQAVAFDFHEICFAVPLLAFSLEALARERWLAAVAWAAPLVLVKEDLPVTVAAIGAYLLLRGQRALGLAVIAGAALALALIVGIAIPAAHPQHLYVYSDSLGADGRSPLERLAQPWRVKATTLLWLLAPTAFVALRSPLLLLALPTLGWRFWSANPAFWGTGLHYSAVLMPIASVAFVDGLRRLHRYRRGWIAAALAVTLAMAPVLPLAELARPGFWRPDPAATAARAALDTIPDGASVAAANQLAPQLTARCRVYLFPTQPSAALRPEWVALPDPPRAYFVTQAEYNAAVAALPAQGYRLVWRGDGVALWQRLDRT